MRKIILVFSILIIILSILILSQKANPKEGIKIGAVLSLSGSYSLIGENMKNGMELAKEEINKEGGIKGRSLEIVYEDSQGDNRLALTAYQKLSFEKIKIIISSISHVVLSLAPLVEKDKILLFAVATAAPSISEAGDFVFRHNLLPQAEAEFLANLIYKQGFKEIGMMIVNSDSGLSYRDEFIKQFGGKIEIIELYERGSSDFKTSLAKIKEKGVKVVLAASYPKELGFILKQAQEIDLNVQWFSPYPAESEELLEIARETAEGLIYTHFFDENSQDPLVRNYKEKYEREYGKASDSYAALSYDSVKVLAEAMRKCSEPEDAVCVKNELYKIKDFPSVTGNVTFDDNGDTQKEIIIKTVRDGKFVLY